MATFYNIYMIYKHLNKITKKTFQFSKLLFIYKTKHLTLSSFIMHLLHFREAWESDDLRVGRMHWGPFLQPSLPSIESDNFHQYHTRKFYPLMLFSTIKGTPMLFSTGISYVLQWLYRNMCTRIWRQWVMHTRVELSLKSVMTTTKKYVDSINVARLCVHP